jgi:hypothetical protein
MEKFVQVLAIVQEDKDYLKASVRDVVQESRAVEGLPLGSFKEDG